MLKHSNKFFRPKPPEYSQLINVWVEDKKRIDIVKRLMIGNKDFKLQKLRINPIYHEVYDVIVKERDTEMIKLDNSLIWSRKYQKKDFFDFIIPFSIWSFIIIPYIFYKVLHKRILEQHVKNDYDAENLKSFGYWNLDFNNKDMYPDSVIELYFAMKQIKSQREEIKEKQVTYNKLFIENVTHRYVNDMIQRRAALGFHDNSDD